MANLNTANSDTILQALQNAGNVMYGPTFNVQQYSSMNAGQLRQFALPSFEEHLVSGTEISQQSTPERFNLKRVSDSVLARKSAILGENGQLPTASATEIQNFESLAMLFGSKEMTIDGQLNGDEITKMEAFFTSLENDTLQADARNEFNDRAADIAAAQAQAEADLAASAELAERTNEIASGLVYGNYLSREDINNPDAVASAFNNMLAEHRDDPGVDIYDLQTNAFADPDNGNWNFSEDAAAIFMDLNGKAALSPEFRNDIESLDGTRVTLAQNYMNLHGKDVAVTGEVNPQTVENAHSLLAQPTNIEGIPESAINGMAAHGQILLPQDPSVIEGILSEDQFAYYNTVFSEADRTAGTYGMSREQFLANTLINEYPEQYQEFLNAQNTAAPEPLNVPEELAMVDTSFIPKAPEAELIQAAYVTAMENPLHVGIDIGAAVNNPFDLEAADETVIGGDSVLTAALEDESLTTTPQGKLVFTEEHLVSQTVAQALVGSAGEDHTLTMGDALGAYYGIEISQNEAFLNGANGSSDRPTHRDGAYVSEKLGFAPDHEFDLTNTTDFQAAMKGVMAYANRYELEGNGHYIDNFLAMEQAGQPTIIALGTAITDVADAQINGIDLVNETTQFAEVAPAEPEAKPFVTSDVSGPQSFMDDEVATFYNQQPELSPSEQLMEQLKNSTPALGSILPTPSMFAPNSDIQSTISLRDHFGASTSPITSTPPAGMDIETPANANMSVINPDLLGTGTDGLTLPDLGNQKPLAQSTWEPGKFSL